MTQAGPQAGEAGLLDTSVFIAWEGGLPTGRLPATAHESDARESNTRGIIFSARRG